MATSRTKKEEQLAKLESGFQKAKGVAFSGYSGMSVAQMSEMRKKMREENVEFVVGKKTLIRKAAGMEIGNEILEGQVGVAFSFDDEVAAARITKELGKVAKTLELKGGVMEGKIIGAEEVKYLASLPGKKELQAKVVGGLINPVRGFVATLNGVISGFARVIGAIQEQKA